MAAIKQPRYRYIIYGDAGLAQEVDKRDLKSKDGVEGWEFLIQPSAAIIDRFNLKERGQLTRTGHCKRWYPKAVVDILDDSPTSGRLFIHTDFDGNDTNYSRRSSNYSEQIITMQKLISVLRAQVASLTYQLRIATSMEHERWKNTKDIVKTIKEMSAQKNPLGEYSDPTQNTEQQ